MAPIGEIINVIVGDYVPWVQGRRVWLLVVFFCVYMTEWCLLCISGCYPRVPFL